MTEMFPDRYDQLESVAWDLYKALSASFCWHCGAAEYRNYETEQILDAFREWVASHE